MAFRRWSSVGVLKNAIDWLSHYSRRPSTGEPIGLIVAVQARILHSRFTNRQTGFSTIWTRRPLRRVVPTVR
jgi:hypothetical protein